MNNFKKLIKEALIPNYLKENRERGYLPNDLRTLDSHPDLELLINTIEDKVGIEVERHVRGYKGPGGEGVYLRTPSFQMWNDDIEDTLKRAFDATNERTEEFNFEFAASDDWDEEPGERTWDASFAFFIDEKGGDRMVDEIYGTPAFEPRDKDHKSEHPKWNDLSADEIQDYIEANPTTLWGRSLSTAEMVRDKKRDEDDEMWTDPAGGTHYGDEDDPAAAYIEEGFRDPEDNYGFGDHDYEIDDYEIGDQVVVANDFKVDPLNKQGETGVVTKVDIENEIVEVTFKDRKTGRYYPGAIVFPGDEGQYLQWSEVDYDEDFTDGDYDKWDAENLEEDSNLKKIEKELKKSSKLHKSQADRIGKITKNLEETHNCETEHPDQSHEEWEHEHVKNMLKGNFNESINEGEEFYNTNISKKQFDTIVKDYESWVERDGDNYHIGNPGDGIELFKDTSKNTYKLQGQGPQADSIIKKYKIKELGIDESINESDDEGQYRIYMNSDEDNPKRINYEEYFESGTKDEMVRIAKKWIAEPDAKNMYGDPLLVSVTHEDYIDDVAWTNQPVNEGVSGFTKIYQIATPFPQARLAEDIEELFGDDYRHIVTEFQDDEGYESILMFNLTGSDIEKIKDNIGDVLIWEYNVGGKKVVYDGPEKEGQKYDFNEPLNEDIVDDKAKIYWLQKLKRGEIDTLPDNPRMEYLRQAMRDQVAHDKEQLSRERGLEESLNEDEGNYVLLRVKRNHYGPINNKLYSMGIDYKQISGDGIRVYTDKINPKTLDSITNHPGVKSFEFHESLSEKESINEIFEWWQPLLALGGSIGLMATAIFAISGPSVLVNGAPWGGDSWGDVFRHYKKKFSDKKAAKNLKKEDVQELINLIQTNIDTSDLKSGVKRYMKSLMNELENEMNKDEEEIDKNKLLVLLRNVEKYAKRNQVNVNEVKYRVEESVNEAKKFTNKNNIIKKSSSKNSYAIIDNDGKELESRLTLDDAKEILKDLNKESVNEGGWKTQGHRKGWKVNPKPNQDQFKTALKAYDKAESEGDIRGMELALAAMDLLKGESVNEGIKSTLQNLYKKAKVFLYDAGLWGPKYVSPSEVQYRDAEKWIHFNYGKEHSVVAMAVNRIEREANIIIGDLVTNDNELVKVPLSDLANVNESVNEEDLDINYSNADAGDESIEKESASGAYESKEFDFKKMIKEALKPNYLK